MTIGKKHEEVNILLNSSTLDQVEEFVYLGSLITEDGKCEKRHQKTLWNSINNGRQTQQDMDVSQHIDKDQSQGV